MKTKNKNAFLFLIVILCYCNLQAQFVGTPRFFPKNRTSKVTTLGCASATHVGSLVSGLEISSMVTTSVSYTGGNGGFQPALVIQSTGVSGLTAIANSGNLNTGSGTIEFTITGTPSTNGTATFAITVGGVSCNFSRTVAAAAIASINCSGNTNTGTSALINGVAVVTNITTSIPYTGGNGGAHAGQNVNSTGVTGLTATLSAGNFEIGPGNLIYNITGTPSGSGTASFAINIGTRTCTIGIAVAPSSVSAISCSGATISGVIKRGVAANGITISIPYTGGNGGAVSQVVSSSGGVAGVTATLATTLLNVGDGTVVYSLSGTPNINGNATFNIAFGTKTCTLTIPVAGTAAVVNCASATNTFNIATGTALTTVSNGTAFTGTYRIPYSGGDGTTTYGSTTTTINGITFTRVAGNQAINTGFYEYTVSGNLINNAVNTFFTLEGCTVGWRPSITVPGFGSNGCNGGGQGGSDSRTTGWQSAGTSNITLTAGAYNLSYATNITVNGVVYSGNPTKELQGQVRFRLVNTSNNQVALNASGIGNVTYSSCSPRGTGNHSASGSYNGSSGFNTLVDGTYRLEIFAESYFGGCSSGSNDQWAGCGLSLNSATVTITKQ